MSEAVTAQVRVFRIRDPQGKRHWLVTDDERGSVNGRPSWSLKHTVSEWRRRFAREGVEVEFESPSTAHTLGDALRIVGASHVPDATLSQDGVRIEAVAPAPSPPAPPPPVERPHISHSQLQMYCKCGEQYRRRYIERDVIPPGIALVRGSAFHKGVAHNFRQKIVSQRDLPQDEVVEFAVSEFDALVDKEGVTLQDDERSAGLGITLARARQATATFVGWHLQCQAPEYHPQLVEQSITIPMPSASRDLLGVVDLLDTRHRVVDFKTTSRKMSQEDVDATTQLTVYAATVTYLTGKPPSALCYDVLVDKSVPERQVLTTTRAREDVVALAARIATVTDAIDRGVFAPTPPDTWWCSARWCGYYRTCPYVRQPRMFLPTPSSEKG